MKYYSIRCIGRVQGVFFRKSTQEVAQRLGVFGWVRNEPNGDVLIQAGGEEAILKQFIDWCKEGPQFADVIEVKVSQIDSFEPDGFQIRY